MSVALSPSDSALVTEDAAVPELTIAPADASFAPPEPTIESLSASAAAAESALPLISSISPASEMPTAAPAKKEHAPRVAVSSGRRPASSSTASRMSAGGGSGSGYVSPQFLVRYKPPYPALARAQRLEGMVLLLVSVDAEGRVTSASVRQGCGYLVLDRAALDSVRSWRFSPARQGDHAIPAAVEVPIRFTFSALGGN